MKIFPSRVKTFADDSTIHGFKELYYSNKCYWKLFWTVTMLCATGVTVYQVIKAIAQFRDQPTVTNIQPLAKGQMLYPSLKLFYGHWTQWVDWKKVATLNVSKWTFLYGFSFIDRTFSEQYFDVELADIELRSVMSKHNWTKLTEFYSALSKSKPDDVHETTGVAFMQMLNAKDFNCGLLMGSLCYEISGDNVSTLMEDLSFIPMSMKTYRKVTFYLTKNDRVKFDSGLFTEVEYKEYAKNTMYYFDVRIKKHANLSNFQNTPILMIGDNLLNFAALSKDFDSFEIKIKADVHVWLNDKRRPCAENVQSDVADYSCRLNCISQFAPKYCQRLHYFFAYRLSSDTMDATCRHGVEFLVNSSASPYDAVEHSGTSLENGFRALFDECECSFESIFDDQALLECSADCLNGCETWDYEITIRSEKYPAAMENVVERNRAKVELYYQTEEAVLVVSEINYQTWENFVANVGGLLGIWLGASVLSFLQTIYLCCCVRLEGDDDVVTYNVTNGGGKKVSRKMHNSNTQNSEDKKTGN